MRFIAMMAVAITCLCVAGFLPEAPAFFGQSYSMIATLIAGTALAYVLARG